MSKELEALERLAMPDDLHIKECKKLGIGLTEDYDLLKQAILELTSIKKAEPSEALECLEKVYSRLPQWDLSRNIDQCNTIKQALLKAQEPKHYLKWEDLKFTRDEKVMLVKMGDTVYKVLYRRCDDIKEVQLLSEDEKLFYISFVGNYKDNVQLFNDLHLERVEE